MTTDDTDDPLLTLVTMLVSAVTLIVAFGLMFLGFGRFWIAFVIGFAGVLPVSVALVEYYREREQTAASDERDDAETALEELRSRYARGELSDHEFERRLEHLLETESIEDAQSYLERRTGTTHRTEPSTYRERETETE